jgi:hypothetical protein
LLVPVFRKPLHNPKVVNADKGNFRADNVPAAVPVNPADDSPAQDNVLPLLLPKDNPPKGVKEAKPQPKEKPNPLNRHTFRLLRRLPILSSKL